METAAKYGFQAHLSPEFPSQIVVDVTEYCNLACGHCPHEDFQNSPAFTGRHLDTELHKKLIDEVASDGRGICKYLRYTAQGEPLIHPKIIEMLQYAGKNSGVPLNMTTNGMLLSEAKARLLLDVGVDVFDISIDAYTPEVYAKIRKKGDLGVTRPNVLKLIELARTGGYKTRIVVSFVEQPLNRHETGLFDAFWKEAGADYVVIRRLHSAAGSKAGLVEVRAERYPCLYPWERLTLAPDGCVHFCPQDWRHGSVIKPFRDETIKSIWQGRFMADLREAHLTGDFSGHGLCGQCPDWSTTRWPKEERSYYNLMQELAVKVEEKGG